MNSMTVPKLTPQLYSGVELRLYKIGRLNNE